MKKILSLILVCSLALAETVISPNMNLPVPIVGTTPGPTWANNINSCMTSIDEHDHTPGKGVPISSAAIDLTDDLSLNGNSLTSVEAVTFSSQASFATTKSLYVISPDIYYNDGNGNTIRLTQSGSVSGASGTITGLPSGTASASYQSVGGTFQFQSATNTPANITGASISIAQQTTTPNSITFKSPTSLAASYNVTWPAAVPAANALVQMGTSGTLTVGPTAPSVKSFLTMTTTGTIGTSILPYYSGYMTTPSTWETSSGTYADGTNTGGNTLTQRFGSGITVTAGASNVCGITWTPSSSTAVYLVSAAAAIYNNSSGNGADWVLTDGTNIVATGNSQQSATGNFYWWQTVGGIYAPATTSPVTLKLQFRAPGAAGNVVLRERNSSTSDNVTWTITQIGL